MPRKAVLVVDDQLEVRELLRNLLGYLGHACQTARNAAEALRKLDETAFDVVLTDLVMPGMKGDELAREIKKRTPSLPVVLITGQQLEDPLPGIDRLLLKPFTAAQLDEVIATLT